ncbi:MAG TPA: sigma-54 dependent transcriptional regulator [Pirellulaceae bacterium]|nr:sigma-54 dependent transcriptional regulator [Pirellulaceae bacterium]HMO94412.1 sigma-54 dependent transcriptional regulator [Pirellulaceae bacterium]HMP71527.1 sigma-54 dependent transcriptional regulator [Pirellulaceae bacterium]
MSKKSILIVDDEPAICFGLSKIVESMGHSAVLAHSAEQAWQEIGRVDVDLIVLDVRLPGISGLEAIRRWRQQTVNVPIVMMTAYGDLETAAQAVQRGVVEYLVKPFDRETFMAATERALSIANSDVSPENSATENEFLGRSRVMREIFNQIALAATSSAHVLVEGESGTGKELVARAIHRFSPHKDQPLVTVHVASLNPNLIESELFGHVKGAFTGAESNRIGWLQKANKCDLFLDEVAEIPLVVQAKLLRALEHGEIYPVGANQPAISQFRIIAATHRNLYEMTRDGSFRQDLYFRLSGFHIRIPPLRERREDIAVLAQHFLSLWNRNYQGSATISHEAQNELNSRNWPGNVRELKHVIERAAISARGNRIDLMHLPEPLPNECQPSDTLDGQRHPSEIVELMNQWAAQQIADADNHGKIYQHMLELIEPPVFEAAVRHCEGQIAPAAKLLGLHRTTLKRRIEQADDE